jgi:hypothetical protein
MEIGEESILSIKQNINYLNSSLEVEYDIENYDQYENNITFINKINSNFANTQSTRFNSHSCKNSFLNIPNYMFDNNSNNINEKYNLEKRSSKNIINKNFIKDFYINESINKDETNSIHEIEILRQTKVKFF